MIVPAISVTSIHRASFDEVGLTTDLSHEDAKLRSHAGIPDSLRSPSIASHLHLIDSVSEKLNTDWVKQLLTQINDGGASEGLKKKQDWIQFMIDHRTSIYRLGEGVALASMVTALYLCGRMCHLYHQWMIHPDVNLILEHQKAASMSFGLLGVSVFVLLPSLFRPEIEHRLADPFMNGPNVIDPNIVDPNELNEHPQNAHAASMNREYVKAFQSLQALIPNPIDKALAKDRILEVFDYLCEEKSFQKEMIALYPLEDDFDATKLHLVKETIESAVHFMIGEAQADRTPMHYPLIVTTSAVLTHIWSCIEHLSVAGHENEARLLTENLNKALYAADGYCNTGHVSRVLQAFCDTIRFGFDQDSQNQESLPVATPQDFYTLNQYDLNNLVSDVVNTDSVRAQLHTLEQKYHLGQANEDRTAYKEAATLVVQQSFVSLLDRYLADHHAPVLRGNAHFNQGLMHFLESDFAAFIDNARDDNDINSIASFS